MIQSAASIDALLGQLAQQNPSDKEEARGRLVAYLIESLGLKTKGSVVNTLFSPGVPAHAQRDLAACLLRFLCADPDLFWSWGDQERRRGLDLIREQLPGVCRAQGVKESDELGTHELHGLLVGAESRVLDRLGGVIESMTNLDTARSTKGSLLQALHHPASAELLGPFLPDRALTDNGVSYVYDRVDEFADAPGQRKLAVYKAAKEALDGLAETVRKDPALYAELALLRPLGRLVGLLEEDLGSSAAVRPASLVLHSSGWKYPLHDPGRSVELKFEVENASGGLAESVELALSSSGGVGFEADPFTTALPDARAGRTDVYVNGTVAAPTAGGPTAVAYHLSWTNFDGSGAEAEGTIELQPQRADLDWEALRKQRPYSLEAVEEEDELVGRTQLVESLFAKLTAKRIESAIVWGQKRVGKTSIARTLQAKLDALSDTATVYIVTNDVTKTTAERFVEELGDGIVEQLVDHPVLSGLGFEPPMFNHPWPRSRRS